MKLAAHILLSMLPNVVKLPVYRFIGYKIEQDARLGFLAVLLVRDKVHLGIGSKISAFTFTKANEFSLGSYSRISSFTLIDTPQITVGRDSLISSFVIIRSGHVSAKSNLVIGDIVHVFPFVTIDCSCQVTIGDETGVGPKCSIFTHSAYKSVLEGYRVQYDDVTIGKRAELTYSVFVAPGVTIGDDAICAYGSYVNKDVPAGVLSAGMPAVSKRTREQITDDVENLDSAAFFNEIIANYGKDIIFLNKQPLNVRILATGQSETPVNGAVYIIISGSLHKKSAIIFGSFDIKRKICSNNGLNNSDFNAFRKYLSRYGIRFITEV